MDVDELALMTVGENNDGSRVPFSDIQGVSPHELFRPPRIVKPEYYLDENGEKKDSIISLPVELIKILRRVPAQEPSKRSRTKVLPSCRAKMASRRANNFGMLIHQFAFNGRLVPADFLVVTDETPTTSSTVAGAVGDARQAGSDAKVIQVNLAADMTNLSVLHMASNGLTGSIPALPSYFNLTSLDLSFNAMRNSIPSTLQSWRLLTYLNLQNNRFTGEINDIGALNYAYSPSDSGVTLYLWVNRLSGMTFWIWNTHYRRVHREKVEQCKGQQSQANKKRFYSKAAGSAAAADQRSNLQADKINMEPTVNVSIFPCPKWKESDGPSFWSRMPSNPALRDDGLLLLKKPYLRVPPQLRIVDLKQFFKMKYLLSDEQLDGLQIIVNHHGEGGALVAILDDPPASSGTDTLFFRDTKQPQHAMQRLIIGLAVELSEVNSGLRGRAWKMSALYPSGQANSNESAEDGSNGC
eukprot:gene35658-46253_t